MFDAFAVVWVLANMYLGFRHGMFRRVVHIAAFFLGLLLAQTLSVGFAQLLNLNTGNTPVSSHFLLFVGIVIGVVVFAEILGFAYASALQFFSGMIFDRFFGLVLGLLAGVFEMTVLLILFEQMFATAGPTGSAQLAILTALNDSVIGSPTAGLLHNLVPAAKVIYSPVLPPKLETYFTKTFS
jgi:uncharacterized membrane protein required for colicin V production